ncbi:trigger factor [Shouchella lonarensis]|uniref:Trigger factor n=1 Tax=Shouchella lonarensis TaxID=1464122 RepID=A0A1G6K1P0_9BACI|nr:trigger factor [Shouchella lonarensis]SDC24545.1 trigger factor [Shouchella lonarensis]
MSVKWEKTEENTVVLTVEVDADQVKDALNKAFKKVVQKVNVPGFRKGKMPRGLFEKQFGVEALYEEAVEVMLPTAYGNAVEEAGIHPVDRPDINVEQIAKDEPFIFTATVTVRPEAKLGDYKGLEVEVPSKEVTEEDVEAALKSLQERHAELVVVEEGEIAEGDTAVIDFTGYVDGEAFEGGAAENHSLEIGSHSFIPGFEEQLIGVAPGAETDVEVTFPEDYHATDLAGKPAVFKVKVHDVKRKQLPTLDDEFAKDADDQVETLDELKSSVREKLATEKEQAAENAEREGLLSQVADNAEVTIPEAMITTEVDRMLEEFGQRLQAQGMNLELYFQFSGQTEEAMREQMKEEAVKRLRTVLALEAIVSAESITVSEEEVDAEIEKMSQTYERSVEEIKSLLAMQGGMKQIESDLQIRKAVDLVMEHSKSVPAVAK